MVNKMIKKEIIKKRYCDICGKQKINKADNCMICKKDLCCYCRYTINEYKRKYPDNGYLVSTPKIGVICKEHINKTNSRTGKQNEKL